MEVHRAKKNSGYGRNWKKWLAIYAVVALIAYAIIYLVLSSNGVAEAVFTSKRP
jgi:hypothetical protein